MTQTPEELMTAFQNGDRDAMGQLYEQLVEPLYCFLFRYTGEKEISIDTVHDVFETLHKKKNQYDVNRGTVKAFVFQIAYRQLVNKLNRRRKWRSLLPSLVPRERTRVSTEDRLAVQKALDTLSDPHRAVILLAYYEDMAQGDIAQILDIPVGTVKSRLHHAIQQLKSRLKEDFPHER
ncbi:RNA polymerase sigma factor [Sporosarcina aquimarina]|uniref:RNA polymerase sigma factor n=2 Tax=Sporosarcina aquimarina TaxID=114975 RepID=A0ABU4G2J8_9BACL|nr:RNA polymerase sigma factor [Sporosarcina aquimarina]